MALQNAAQAFLDAATAELFDSIAASHYTDEGGAATAEERIEFLEAAIRRYDTQAQQHRDHVENHVQRFITRRLGFIDELEQGGVRASAAKAAMDQLERLEEVGHHENGFGEAFQQWFSTASKAQVNALLKQSGGGGGK